MAETLWQSLLATAIMAAALIGTLAVVQYGDMAVASTTGGLWSLFASLRWVLPFTASMPLKASRVIKFADLVRAVVRA